MTKNKTVYAIFGAIAAVLLAILSLNHLFLNSVPRKINFFFLPTVLIPFTFAIMLALYPLRKQEAKADRFGKIGDIILIIIGTVIVFCSTVQVWSLIFRPER